MFKSYFSKEYLIQNKDKVVKLGAIVLILAVAIVIFLIKENAAAEENDYLEQPSATVEQNSEQNEESVNDDGFSTESVAGESIVIDVSGAVNKPSVVTLAADSRVEDAITAAGGLKQEADLSDINRAAFLTDGEKIVIPAKGKSKKNKPEESVSAETDGRININTADSDTLQQLTGIGPALAGRIIDYRKSNGNFKGIEDIKQVSGIGEKTFEKFKEKIKV